jgi:hypothetical protein
MPCLINRALLFNTPNALHGFPEPLRCPENQSRKSPQLYYYTVDKTPDAVPVATTYYARPEDSPLKRLLVRLDNLALEPFVRRHWPRTLVSWTTLLGGDVRHPIVGRDVLLGVALGVAIALLVRSTLLQGNAVSWPPTELLLGVRVITGSIVQQLVYAVRGALLFFFLIFLLRVVLRNEWAAALAFVALWTVLDVLDSETPLIEGATTALYSGMLAFAVLRWGLTTLTVGVFVANLLLNAPAPTDLTAWYAGGTVLLGAIPILLAAWAFYTSVKGQIGQAELRRT